MCHGTRSHAIQHQLQKNKGSRSGSNYKKDNAPVHLAMRMITYRVSTTMRPAIWHVQKLEVRSVESCPLDNAVQGTAGIKILLPMASGLGGKTLKLAAPSVQATANTLTSEPGGAKLERPASTSLMLSNGQPTTSSRLLET
eukprot:357202-Chlamydomonas_euryale.AAC.10